METTKEHPTGSPLLSQDYRSTVSSQHIHPPKTGRIYRIRDIHQQQQL